jgi:hypothetical protein
VAFGLLILGFGVRVVANRYARQSIQRERSAPDRDCSEADSMTSSCILLGLELILLAFALRARTWACFAVVLVPPTSAVLYRIHV